MALLVSGLNFYAVDSRGRKVRGELTDWTDSTFFSQNGVTMGLARVGGMCTVQHNCVIGASI